MPVVTSSCVLGTDGRRHVSLPSLLSKTRRTVPDVRNTLKADKPLLRSSQLAPNNDPDGGYRAKPDQHASAEQPDSPFPLPVI